MNIVSRFRTEYWAWIALSFVGGAFITGLCVYYSFESGELDFSNLLFWMACIGIITIVVSIHKFLYSELKQLTVSDRGVSVKYFLTGKTFWFSFDDILSFKTRRIRSTPGAGHPTDGYQELEIELYDGGLIIFTENQFENYVEVKTGIYLGKRNA